MPTVFGVFPRQVGSTWSVNILYWIDDPSIVFGFSRDVIVEGLIVPSQYPTVTDSATIASDIEIQLECTLLTAPVAEVSRDEMVGDYVIWWKDSADNKPVPNPDPWWSWRGSITPYAHTDDAFLAALSEELAAKLAAEARRLRAAIAERIGTYPHLKTIELDVAHVEVSVDSDLRCHASSTSTFRKRKVATFEVVSPALLSPNPLANAVTIANGLCLGIRPDLEDEVESRI